MTEPGERITALEKDVEHLRTAMEDLKDMLHAEAEIKRIGLRRLWMIIGALGTSGVGAVLAKWIDRNPLMVLLATGFLMFAVVAAFGHPVAMATVP